MPQCVLPYKYEEKNAVSMTALAGLPVYLDLASVLGLGEHIRQHMTPDVNNGHQYSSCCSPLGIELSLVCGRR